MALLIAKDRAARSVICTVLITLVFLDLTLSSSAYWERKVVWNPADAVPEHRMPTPERIELVTSEVQSWAGSYRGMFHNLSIYNQLAASMANQPPHAQAQTRQTTVTNLLTLQNGFPPVTPGSVPNTIAVDPFYKIGYAQMWNLATEAQLSQEYTIEFTYTGTKGTHLMANHVGNPLIPAGFNPADPKPGPLSRLYPGFGNMNITGQGGSSSFNSARRASAPMAIVLPFTGCAVDPDC